MYILGISALYHDSAACLLKNGEVIFAAQEERFSRIKHDSSFPVKSIRKALEFASISMDDIELVCFYEKPFQKFERIIDSYASHSPRGFWSFKKAMKSWFSKKLWISDLIKKELNYKGEIIYSNHHESHSAGTFFSSPFSEAAIITMDGVGERASATIGIGKGNRVEIIQNQEFPHSLGLFYSAMTYYCGFKVNSGEYKLMGLAPYGKPIYVDLIKSHLIEIKENGSIKLNLKHFGYEVGLKMIRPSFEKVLGEKARTSETKMTQFYMDVAASTQKITEEAVIKTVKYAQQITGLKNVCLSGGVALNCVANSKLLEFIKPENIWVQPASGDSGGAIGSAFVGWYHHLSKERKIQINSLNSQVYLGSTYSKPSIKKQLNEWNIKFKELPENEMLELIAVELNTKKVIGWFEGRMEFGPRALGNRSILASPVFPDMKHYLNQKIKKREGFRPFAPMVLEEKAKEWFDMNSPSKYMLFTQRSDKSAQIPSCVHADLTARVQTVNKNENVLIYSLLEKFEKKTGVPVLINTSFNERGEPIVESPEDAIHCFFNTGIDILVIEGLIIEKEQNLANIESFKSKRYELD